ncbi:YbaN family protein [Desemzia sp. FAM 23989]|uniref:YbaN family protein n=1 Tax=Desemzia sp. FAM 23989 TaxID=3259523 RepID=UPI003884ED7B
MKRIALITVGFMSFGLGSIGVLLPILPTTPFLLLSAFCFTRSSDRFDVWIRQTRLYVADYMETRTIPMDRKWKILLNIYLLMGFSIFCAPILPVKIGLALLTVGITFFLFVLIPSS